MDVVADHPLFEGGLCKGCKVGGANMKWEWLMVSCMSRLSDIPNVPSRDLQNSFMEYAYLFDDDGTQV